MAIVQLVHLGRETLGAETYWSPVAPSAVRSPREPTVPRAMLDREVDAFVDGFRVASEHAAEAGFDGIEPHAAPDGVAVTAQPSGRQRFIAADRVIAVGERRTRPLPDLAAPTVMAIGDGVVPRRAAHAIAEGRAAGVHPAAAMGG